MTDNVLLHLGEEPRFDAIQTADIKPALQTAIAEARAQIAEIKAQTHTDWANTVERLTDITERVGRIWGVVSHLNSVVDTPELRAVYNELMPEITIFFTEIGQDIELYNRFKTIKNSPEFATLPRTKNQAQPRPARFRPQRRRIAARTAGRAGKTANRRRATLRQILAKRLRRNRRLRPLL